ncbi:MAG: hypothetical protein GY859_14770 [Desulfobacterales bacterium]|nr:hypothetical protein [Desulfobacterales bacterium]
MAIKKKTKETHARVHLTKKCPKCYRYMDLKLSKCPSCGVRVGNVDEHGMAVRPINWRKYLSALVAWVALALFIWWAFFKP